MEPVLEKMCDLLIAKNVAADIAKKLCESVAVKLDGKVRVLLSEFFYPLGTFISASKF
jgi:signal recognition particle GTPase